ncbi:MAG: DUF2283 domain-containing protein, partial [Ginsengibacter sp.]
NEKRNISLQSPKVVVTAYRTSKLNKYESYTIKKPIFFIKLNEKPVDESDEDKPGIILDDAEDGSVVGIEILNTSSKMPQPNALEYEVE